MPSNAVGLATPDPAPSVDELEAVLGRYRLDFDRLRDPRAEQAAFPSMVGVFTRLAAGGYPPEQAAFVAAFRDQHVADAARLFTEDRWRGTRARLLRAYPSFVRDHHLAALLREHGHLCVRGDDADSRWGVDLVLVHGPHAVRLHCFVATGAGQAWRLTKQRRRRQDGYSIDVPLYRERARTIGHFQLYGVQDVVLIEQRLRVLLPDGPQAGGSASLPPPETDAWWAA